MNLHWHAFYLFRLRASAGARLIEVWAVRLLHMFRLTFMRSYMQTNPQVKRRERIMLFGSSPDKANTAATSSTAYACARADVYVYVGSIENERLTCSKR